MLILRFQCLLCRLSRKRTLSRINDGFVRLEFADDTAIARFCVSLIRKIREDLRVLNFFMGIKHLCGTNCLRYSLTITSCFPPKS